MRLRLDDFRNYSALDWRLPGERLLLVGGNGAGKTSLLEAIYLAATSRSFRTARLEECVLRGSSGFSIALEEVGDAHRRLTLGWRAGEGSSRALDGKSVRLSEQLAAFPLLVWTEAERGLVDGGPAERRRFFDRGLVLERPALLGRLGRYQRALAEKRTLLAAGGGGDQLAAWNELLADEGSAIAAARAGFAAAVAEGLATVATASPAKLPAVTLRYRPSPAAALDGREAYFAALAAASRSERERRRPLLGVHRDEIELLWSDAPARRSASAGERKTLGLLLLAAVARRVASGGRDAPALLLDDADAELDRPRLEGLMATFAGWPRLLVTSNRPEVWADSAALETVAVAELAGPPEGRAR